MAVVTGSAGRRTCPECRRRIAVPGGRFARHDPPERGPIMLSCPGSLKPAPPGAAGLLVPEAAVPLFELTDAEPVDVDVAEAAHDAVVQ